MRKIKFIFTLFAVVVLVAVVALVGEYLRRREPLLLQGITECRTLKAASKIPGRIEQVCVQEGEQVRQGELLYILSTPELSAKLEQVTALRSAAEALDARVEQGARAPQIEAALNLWQQAQAGAVLASKSYERAQNLYREGVIPAQKLDEARASYESMRALESAARAQYDLVLEGADKYDVEAAAAQVKEAEGGVAEVEAYLKDAMVYAPISGEVSTIGYHAGEVVGSGYPVVTILDLEDVWITFNIKESLLPRIRLGESVQAWVPALGEKITLQVRHIAAQADFATWDATRTRGGFDVRTFAVKMYPEDKGVGLRPGMSAVINYEEL